MFVDASALCAIFLGEPEKAVFESKLAGTANTLVSPIVVWETVRAVVRATGAEPGVGRRRVADYLELAEARTVAIGVAEQEAALDAFERFGKGRHPARLNLGDCFAYACAKTHGVPLLFKGEDFALTDVAPA